MHFMEISLRVAGGMGKNASARLCGGAGWLLTRRALDAEGVQQDWQVVGEAGSSEGGRVKGTRHVEGDIGMRLRCAGGGRVGFVLVGESERSWSRGRHGAAAFIAGLRNRSLRSSRGCADVVEAGAALHGGWLILREQAESFRDSGWDGEQRYNKQGHELEQALHVSECEYLPSVPDNQ